MGLALYLWKYRALLELLLDSFTGFALSQPFWERVNIGGTKAKFVVDLGSFGSGPVQDVGPTVWPDLHLSSRIGPNHLHYFSGSSSIYLFYFKIEKENFLYIFSDPKNSDKRTKILTYKCKNVNYIVKNVVHIHHPMSPK